MKPCCNDSCDPKEVVPLKSFRALVKKVNDQEDLLVPQDGTQGQVLTWLDGEDKWNTFTVSWNQVTDKPATFPPSAHTHPISDVIDLQTALDNKAALVHGHAQSDISGLVVALAGKAPVVTKTVTATVGDVTLNTQAGTINVAAADTLVTVTNSLVTADSLVFCFLRTQDVSAVLDSAVPSAGSFVVRFSVAPTAQVSVAWIVF